MCTERLGMVVTVIWYNWYFHYFPTASSMFFVSRDKIQDCGFFGSLRIIRWPAMGTLRSPVPNVKDMCT